MIGGGAAAGGVADSTGLEWREALARAGRETELGEDLVIGFSMHIAETREKAEKEAARYFEENMKMFAPLGFVRDLTDDQVRATADPARAPLAGLPTIQDGVEAGSWLCGPPEDIIERLMALQDRYPGLEYVNVGSVVGTPQSVILEQLEWFGKDVMPAFKGAIPVAGRGSG